MGLQWRQPVPRAASPRVLRLLARRDFILCDGAVGSVLADRGVDMRAVLDDVDEHDNYWSGKALITDPAAVRALHGDYLRAGVDVISTNTFRVNRVVVRQMAAAESAEELPARAVSMATAARDAIAPDACVAGSVGPIESCDAPERAPDDERLHEEHGVTLRALAGAGVDLLLLETMNSIRESCAAAREARRTGLPFVVSFSLRPEDGRLPSGEELTAAASTLLPLEPAAMLVNHCRLSCVERALTSLAGVIPETAPYRAKIGCRGRPDPTPSNRRDRRCSPFREGRASTKES